jgi:outer membrane receptor protein involved in Fe transport
MRTMVRRYAISIGIGIVFNQSVSGSASAQRMVVSDVARARDAVNSEEIMARTIRLQLENAPIEFALNVIAEQAGLRVQYRSEVLRDAKSPVTLHSDRISLGTAMERVLRGAHVMVVAAKADLLVLRRVDGEAVDEGVVTGRVIDAKSKLPLRGVTVTLDASTQGRVTKEDGAFRFPAVATGSHTIRMRMLGYVKQAKTVDVTQGATSTVEVAMEPSANALDQVIVTGTVVATELKAVPNAITVITAKQIQDRGITRIDQLFRGDVPGMFASNTGAIDALGEGTVVFSRGATTLPGSVSRGTARGTNAIKTYVDGVELANPKFLFAIDPRSIERIEILTGPQASTIYGSGAINGVMQIFTKRGTTAAPQVLLNLSSGLVQNDYSTALTPQHNYDGQISGVDGRVSYNAGASWSHTGSWTPSIQLVQKNIYGGVRLAFTTPIGGLTADASLRRNNSKNVERGSVSAQSTMYEATGYYLIDGSHGRSTPSMRMVSEQSIGATINYTPFSWWSHTLQLGQNFNSTESRNLANGYLRPDDTTHSFSFDNLYRNSQNYSTTARISLASFATANVTAGVDGWQLLRGSFDANRRPEHNTGAFVQSQISLGEQLFLTYGLRAEWSPSFGQAVLPNYAPRYGVAYVTDVGPVTAKLRASYGRSTRPPYLDQKLAAVERWSEAVTLYGAYDTRLANHNLEPEHQQGGEGGVELYIGTRTSLVVTRYNQTVDGIIVTPVADSVRSLLPNPWFYRSRDAAGYGYVYQQKSLNIGSIRNQGWELQSNITTGPITTRGSYSWTKSRVIGISPQYQKLFPARDYPDYRPGATFQYLAEHTWGLGATYAQSRSTVALAITGIGSLVSRSSAFRHQALDWYSIRLQQNAQNTSASYSSYVSKNSGYAMADVTASHRFSSWAEGVLQVRNLADYYANDFDAEWPVLGRQTMFGLRIRL